MGTSAYLLRKSAPAAGGKPRSARTHGHSGLNLTLPAVSLARWSGQRDVRVFALQIRTGCGRLSATLPARYKRFAFI